MSNKDQELKTLVNSFVDSIKNIIAPTMNEATTNTSHVCEVDNNHINQVVEKVIYETLSPCNYVTLCNPDKIEQRISILEPESVWKKTLENLAQPKQMSVIHADLHNDLHFYLKDWAQEHANFTEPAEYVSKVLRLCALRESHFRMRPILLYGPPGCGKTRWVSQLCKLLRMSRISVDLSGSSDFIKVTGSSRSWKSAGPGEIAVGLARSETGNPILVLDEIDKVYASHQGNPLDRILLLTEEESAKEFNDDFVEVPIDTTNCSIIAMANSIENLPKPLLSRFECFEIKQLDFVGRKIMIQNVYQEFINTEKLKAYFFDTLDEDILEQFASSSLEGRELKSAIQDAVYSACEEIQLNNLENTRQREIDTKHLRLKSRTSKNSIGFIR